MKAALIAIGFALVLVAGCGESCVRNFSGKVLRTDRAEGSVSVVLRSMDADAQTSVLQCNGLHCNKIKPKNLVKIRCDVCNGYNCSVVRRIQISEL